MDWDLGLAVLKKHATGTRWHSAFLVQEAAWHQNRDYVRLHGDAPQTQQDRSRIIHELNELALKHLHVSFNDLCLGEQVPSPPQNEASSITMPAPSSKVPTPDTVQSPPLPPFPKTTHNLPLAPDSVPAATPNRPTTSPPAKGFQLLHTLSDQAGVLALAFSPDGETLVSGGLDKNIRLWLWSKGEQQQPIVLECTCPIQVLVFNPRDKKILVSGHDDGTIRAWNLENRALCYPVIGHNKCVTSLAISNDGNVLASGSYDGTIRLWTLSDGKQWHAPFAPKTFAGRSLNPALKELLKSLVPYEPHISSVTFDPHNQILASGHDDKTIWLWHLDTENEPLILDGHLGEVLHILIGADGKLISGSKNDEFRLWNLPGGELVKAFSLVGVSNSTEKVEAVAISPNGKIVANGDRNGTIRLLHLDTMEAQTLHVKGEVWSLAFSPRERLLASGGKNGKIQIWQEQDTPPIDQKRQSVFISYSHQDTDSQLELRTHLAYYAREGVVEYWDDAKIQVGKKWYEAIQQAIHNAKIAILLISPNFFASEFIAQHELPWLLAAAERGEITIFCVILRESSFEDTKLAQFQTVNSPSAPLIDMSISNRDKVWKKVVDLVRDRLQQQR